MLPHKIITKIINFLMVDNDISAILCLLSTNKYYSSTCCFFPITNYITKFNNFTYRKVSPIELNLLNIEQIDNILLQDIISNEHYKYVPTKMSIKMFQEQNQFTHFFNLELHNHNNYLERKINIDKKYNIETLNLCGFINKKISIECENLSVLKITECKKTIFRVNNQDNTILTIECLKNIKCKLFGIENNVNLNFCSDCDSKGKLNVNITKIEGIIKQTEYNKECLKKSKKHHYETISNDIVQKLIKKGYTITANNVYYDSVTNNEIENILKEPIEHQCIFTINENIELHNLEDYALTFNTGNTVINSIKFINCSIDNLIIDTNYDSNITLNNCIIDILNTNGNNKKINIKIENSTLRILYNSKKMCKNENIFLNNSQIDSMCHREHSNITEKNSIIGPVVLNLDEYQESYIHLLDIGNGYFISGVDVNNKYVLKGVTTKVICNLNYDINWVGLAYSIKINNNMSGTIYIGGMKEHPLPVPISSLKCYNKTVESNYTVYTINAPN